MNPLPRAKNLACKLLNVLMMSSIENIYKKMAESAAGNGNSPEATRNVDSAQHIPPGVAHELNNIIAIIRGYTDRLLVKHSQDPTLEPHLKLISNAARRAGLIVREAMPPQPSPTRVVPPPPQQPTA
jgi:hypothetical protein